MRLATTAVIVTIVGLVAWAGGSAIGNYVSERKKAGFKERRAEQTQQALDQHFDLKIGDYLPDRLLETLTGDTVSLASLLTDESYLVAVHPNCKTCLEEMAEIARLQREHNALGPFVFVSSANPRELAEIRDSLGLQNPILYDHRGKLLSQFNLTAFPCFLKLDSQRRVTDFVLGTLLPEEIEAALPKD